MLRRLLLTIIVSVAAILPAGAIEKPGVVYKVFQFPADKIPRIDGNTDDWAIVPDAYVIGMDQLTDTQHGLKPDPKDLDVRVRVGWVKGLNRLYFLYEAYDNYWDFSRLDLHNDMFELVVNADLSGGPFIRDLHPQREIDPWAIYRAVQGVHAQNWHIFTPPGDKDWAMVWGCQQPWIRELPYANAAYSYNFKPGESGRLTLEFYITPFDYASCDGPEHSVESRLQENKLIGMAWAVKDYDDPNTPTSEPRAFWNLSPSVYMYGDASRLVTFRLMPLEERFHKPVEAQFSLKVVDLERRVVAFQDLSYGNISSWQWDFGDGASSAEQHPIHTYLKGGEYIVTLTVHGPAGQSRRAKVWDVVLK
jgi:hypothetical protein